MQSLDDILDELRATPRVIEALMQIPRGEAIRIAKQMLHAQRHPDRYGHKGQVMGVMLDAEGDDPLAYQLRVTHPDGNRMGDVPSMFMSSGEIGDEMERRQKNRIADWMGDVAEGRL